MQIFLRFYLTHVWDKLYLWIIKLKDQAPSGHGIVTLKQYDHDQS